MRVAKISKIQNNYDFKSNVPSQKEKKDNSLFYVCTGMMVLPLAPVIDGDGFKSITKNRNVMKYLAGMATIGGGIAGSKLLYKKYSDSPNKTFIDTLVLAVAGPLILAVDEWSTISSKNIAKKWYALAVIVGGATGYIMSKIKKSK